LIDFERSMPKAGYGSDIIMLGIYLKLFRDPEPEFAFYYIKSIDELCPDPIHCPGGMRQLLGFVRSLRSDNVPVDVYDRF
jgi:hypothetical protein